MSSEIFRLKTPFNSPRIMTQAFLQAGHCLNFYQAELARILELKCHDIGRINSAQLLLQPQTIEYQRAILFILMYQALYDKFNGQAIAMYHWLHRNHDALNDSPFLLMVDKHEILRVVDYLSITYACTR